MVNEASEVTAEQLEAYKPTGKKKRAPRPRDHTEPQNVLARPVQEPASAAELPSERVYIRLPNGEDQQTLLKLKATIDDFRGNTEVVLVLGSDDNKQAIKLPSKIDNQKPALSRLMETVGAANVIVQ